MNDWDPRENPLVQRAFRTGFRSGPGSFRLGWWATGLSAVILIPFILQAIFTTVSLADAILWMFNGLLVLILLVFVIGGFQRMLTSFSKERERGTFDFLHLSTLRSTGIVVGFLMAGQLPGYLALVLLSPILIICAFMIEFPIGTLLALLAAVVFYALVLSMLFLYLGFWAKKASEFRGAAIVYILLALFFGSVLSNWLMSVNVLPAGWGQILLGVPLIKDLYFYGISGAEQLGPAYVLWYGYQIQSWVAAMIALTPPTLILFASLCASLRHRERIAWSLRRYLLMYAWIAVVAIGAWVGQPTPIWNRWLMFSIISWVVILKLAKKACVPRTQTVHELGRADGDWSTLLRGSAGPPFLLTGILTLIYLLGCALIGIEKDATERAVSPFTGASVGLLLVLPLFASILLQQWALWRAPAAKIFLTWVHIFFIWIPLGVFAFGADFPPWGWISPDVIRGFGGISPFSQILSLARAGSEDQGFVGLNVFVYQGIYLAICLFAARGCWAGGLSVARACRTLLEGERKSGEDAEAAATV